MYSVNKNSICRELGTAKSVGIGGAIWEWFELEMEWKEEVSRIQLGKTKVLIPREVGLEGEDGEWMEAKVKIVS